MMISDNMRVQHQDLRELTKVLKEQNTLLGKLVKEFKEYRKGAELSECILGTEEDVDEQEL